MTLHRIALFRIAVVTGGVILGTAVPALASISGATISTTQPSYTGVCPVSIAFTGSITGTAGTVFTYSFNRYVNNTQQVVNGGTVTMPASGTYPVNDSISISASTSPATFDQIWVHNISGGQADLYSAKANFSVTCGPPATPTPNPRGVLHPGTTTLLRPDVTLHSTFWGDREYSYKWTGIAPCEFERGAKLPTEPVIGWFHSKSGDSAWLCHWNTFDRAFIGFDQSKIQGTTVKQALLVLTFDGTNQSCYGGTGRALLQKVPLTLFTQTTFTSPYPEDGDFNWPTTTGSVAGGMTVDVTSIVQKWADGTMKNDGFVVRGSNEDNGSNGNDGCFQGYKTDAILVIHQM